MPNYSAVVLAHRPDFCTARGTNSGLLELAIFLNYQEISILNQALQFACSERTYDEACPLVLPQHRDADDGGRLRESVLHKQGTL